MAKRKGSSTPSSSRARKKVDNDATDVESAHEKRLLERLLEKRHEDGRSERKGSSVPSSSRARKKADRDAKEAESTQRLDKLPPEVWEKILDQLGQNDLFPLALSCRYFRQKQKDLVARTRQSGKPCLALQTALRWQKGKPVSADYLRFCSKEKVSWEVRDKKARCIRRLAAFYGHLPLLQELLGPSWTNNNRQQHIAWAAARGGQLETLQWLRAHKGIRLNTAVFSEACRGGHLEILKWLRSEDCTCSADACSDAAKGGHLEVLKWLRSEGCPWNAEASWMAAEHGHLEALKWLRSEGCPWNESACAGAAKGGHLGVLKWLRSEGCPWNEEACWGAAQHGHLGVLKWLRSEGCPWDEETCSGAAEYGHLDVLKYLHENGCPWDERTCASAAENGHLITLKYAHENGCPWDEETCHVAAEKGHLDVLKYARENGCPCNCRTWPAALLYSRLNSRMSAVKSCLDWLDENGCPQDYVEDDENSYSDEYDYSEDHSVGVIVDLSDDNSEDHSVGVNVDHSDDNSDDSIPSFPSDWESL